jgi:hypothetical protein
MTETRIHAPLPPKREIPATTEDWDRCERLIGKYVTLPRGVLATVVDTVTVNGAPDPRILSCRTKDGDTTTVLACVIDALPITHRREDFRW